MIWGERINDLSPLPPENYFRAAMIDGAKQFVRQMARTRERYRLLTNEADLQIYWPAVSRGIGKTETANFKAIAVAEGEVQWPEEMSFVIVGDFLAEFGFLVPPTSEEEQHQIKVASVAEWRAAEREAEAQLMRERRR